MHDCPGCRVPLNDHETVCPSCGTRQPARRSSSKLFEGETKKPSVNPMPFIIVFVLVLAGVAFAAQSSWVGQLMTRGPVAQDPLANVTAPQARQMIETKITEGVAAVGGTASFKYTRAGAEVDKNSEGPIEMAVEVALQQAEQRKPIMEPVKELMEKAQVTTLTMNDPKLKATWTYNLSAAPASATPAAAE